MIIRPAKPQDIEQIIELCEAHALYEDYFFIKTDKVKSLSNYLFNHQELVHCLVIVENTHLLGYVTFMKQFSTWEATCYLYLDCLFLDQKIRGKGIGKKIMNKVKEFAQENDCSWIEWQTPKSNEKAIHFYQKIGANSKSKERFYWK